MKIKDLELQKISFDTLPTSLQQHLLANVEAIEAIEAEREKVYVELIELKQKKDLMIKIGNMNLQGIKGRITRRNNYLKRLDQWEAAYRSGYLEIPDLDRNAWQLNDGNKNSKWATDLPVSAPIRCFEALARAKGMFDKTVIYQDQTDPIVAGVIGNRRFFITSWR
jgi:hypothetical protein